MHRTAVSVCAELRLRQEITEAVRTIVAKVATGEIKAGEIDESTINAALSTSPTPDPDLIIRTSGELRLSNFLMWQAAYSEFYFTSTLWPDFTEASLDKALADYQSRQRRFGAVAQNDEKPFSLDPSLLLLLLVFCLQFTTSWNSLVFV